jgi:two-component system, cell cycle sensor histidine kinase and response regulator CckA
MAGKPAYNCLENELCMSAEMFTQLLELVPFSVALSRMDDGRYLLVNEGFCRNTGFSKQEIIGRTPADLDLYCNPEDRALLVQELKLHHKVEKFQIAFKVKDGTVYINSVTAKAIRHKGEDCILSVSTFQLPPPRFQKDMHQSRDKFRAIAESLAEGYYETDLAGNMTFFNEAVAKGLGYSRQELTGMNYRSYTAPESVDEILQFFSETYERGASCKIIDYTFVRKDGTRVIAETSANLLRKATGEPEGFYGIIRDRTQQKRSERALQESEQKYRSILEEMEEGYYETDLEGNFTYFNNATCKIHGYSEAELTGMNYRQYVSPETARQINRLFRQIYRTGQSARLLDYEIIRKDASICILEMSAYPSRDPEGRITGFWGISRDRTERRRAELALQDSESRLRSIFENAAVGIAYFHIAGEFIRVNKGFCDLLGCSSAELAGMKAFDFTHPDDQLRENEEIERLLNGKKKYYTLEKRLIAKDGTLLWVRTTVSPALGDQGKPMFFIAVLENITERKRAAEALQHSEERYRLLVENASEGIYITQDGLIKFLNPKMEEICGCTDQDLINQPISDLLHPEDKALIYDRQQIRLKHLPDLFSFRILNKDKEVLWVELSTVGITWEGKPASLNFLRDITPQKKIEAQLLQAKKMEAIGTLAGGIAHDFNNILMGIEGNATLILVDMPPEHPHCQKLRNIERYIKAGANLTKQLLGTARGGKYEVRSTDLNKVIDISSELFGRTKKEIVIHKKLFDGLWPVEVDRGQIEQVLLNCYVNAWHAMPDGGDLFLETANVELDDYYVRPYGVPSGKYCKISLTDTGVGIAPQDQKRIFDPFFTTKPTGMGTGLGLSSAYGIIANHGGIINVYSEKGAGTTFNIYLPATGKEVIEYVRPQDQILTGTETILFVDDEEGIVDVSRLILKRLGYRVITALGGREALEIYKARKDEIDLVILDMIMPGMSGGDTFNELKEIRPDVIVVLSSGYSLNGQAKHILDRGCSGFIQKPFSLRDLSIKLRQILDPRTLQKRKSFSV